MVRSPVVAGLDTYLTRLEVTRGVTPEKIALLRPPLHDNLTHGGSVCADVVEMSAYWPPTSNAQPMLMVDMMNLGEFKSKIECMSEGAILHRGISQPFSWRGSYDEVAFSIVESISRETALERIDEALSNTFYGYKGGEYRFNEYTPVNFERSGGSYTDGEYRDELISEIEGSEISFDRDMKLANLITR